MVIAGAKESENDLIILVGVTSRSQVLLFDLDIRFLMFSTDVGSNCEKLTLGGAVLPSTSIRMGDKEGQETLISLSRSFAMVMTFVLKNSASASADSLSEVHPSIISVGFGRHKIALQYF